MQSAIKQFAALSESANPSDDQRDRCDRCGSFFVEVPCQYVSTGPSYWTCKCFFSPPPQLFQKSWTYFCLQFVIVNLDCLYLSLKTKLSQLNKLNEVVVFFFFYWITNPFYQLLWELGAYIIPQFRVYTVPHGNSSTKKPSRCWLLWIFVHSLFDEFQALRNGIGYFRFYLGLLRVVLGNFHLLRYREINKWFVDNGKTAFGFRLGHVGKCSATWAQQRVLYMQMSNGVKSI